MKTTVEEARRISSKLLNILPRKLAKHPQGNIEIAGEFYLPCIIRPEPIFYGQEKQNLGELSDHFK